VYPYRTLVMNNERKASIIAYLDNYIRLCQRYQMLIIGGIGSQTGLLENNPHFYTQLHSTIYEMVYGLEDSNLPLPKDQYHEIFSKLKRILDNPNPPERPY